MKLTSGSFVEGGSVTSNLQSMLSSSRSLLPQNDIVNSPTFTTRTLRFFITSSSWRLQRKKNVWLRMMMMMMMMMMMIMMMMMLMMMMFMVITMTMIMTKMMTTATKTMVLMMPKWRRWLRKVIRGYCIGGEEEIEVFPAGFQFDWTRLHLEKIWADIFTNIYCPWFHLSPYNKSKK